MTGVTVELSDDGQFVASNSRIFQGMHDEIEMKAMRAARHEPAELPPYRAVLVADVKDFSGTESRYHSEITREIPRILENAFARCGHGYLRDAGFGGPAGGDGYFRIVDPVYLPYLLNPFLQALQDELTEQNNMLPRAYGNLRMRVSLSVGPVTDSGEDLLGDGNGATRIEAHRILDSHPVRDILDRSSDVTRVAAIVTSRVYQDAVLSGYAAEDRSLYVPVDVQVKTFEGSAYLRVPTPSGQLISEGVRPRPSDADVRPSSGEAVERRPRPQVMGIGEHHGDVHQLVAGAESAEYFADGGGRAREGRRRDREGNGDVGR